MDSYHENREEEQCYLEKTLTFIKHQLEKEEEELQGKRDKVVASRREMWEESVHFSNDIDRVPEMIQYLSEVNTLTRDYSSTVKRIERYNNLLKSPYFGRFDFVEDAIGDTEKIYIGLSSLMDPNTASVLVYDWRAPISSIFYRSELGRAAYQSPMGLISGEVLLKRQYKIQASKLKYFFDSSIRVNDEILQEVLSHNSSPRMRNIVETIQKEQDVIIRDTISELLIVQGVAGSGKTSIALHRIAYLLYIGLQSKLNTSNIIIVSPNSIFSKYISNVLPELGEDNVKQITFDDIAVGHLGKRFRIQSRNEQLEYLICKENSEEGHVAMGSMEFKGSETFLTILKRLIKHYEYRAIPFKDVYYDGKVIETRQQLKNMFLNNKIGMPITKRLKRMENMMLNRVYPMRKVRLEKIEKLVQKYDDHIFEIKAFSRLLSIKETKVFMEKLHSFTEVDYMELYKKLFNEKGLLLRLSKGLRLPDNINKIIEDTAKRLDKGLVLYEDCAPLLYIKLAIGDNEDSDEIKQVVIDEAQDYYPLQFEVFKQLYGRAKYTVLGDYNQTLERRGDSSLYDVIEAIINKSKSTKLFLNKSYRSSIEINSFNRKLLREDINIIPFERHEDEPKVIAVNSVEELDKCIVKKLEQYFEQGYESAAILCKTAEEGEKIAERLKKLTMLKVLNIEEEVTSGGIIVMPSYMSKGLEFDVVIVYDASAMNYYSDFDRKLLYIACTRALHRLVIYHVGEKCKFLE